MHSRSSLSGSKHEQQLSAGKALSDRVCKYNTWEPSSNILNENLFTESGFPIPSDFKSKNRKAVKSAGRKRKRKAKEIVSSDESDEDNQSYEDDDATESTHSEASVGAPTATSSAASKSGTVVVAAGEEEPPVKESSKTPAKPRKGGPKGKRKCTSARSSSASASKKGGTKKEDKKIDEKQLKGEKSDETVMDMGPSKMQGEKGSDVKGPEKKDTELDNNGDHAFAVENEVREQTAPKDEVFKIISDDEGTPVKDEKIHQEAQMKVPKPEVFRGRSATVQVVASGQEQTMKRLAFVIDNTPDSSRTTEELQLQSFGNSNENQIRAVAKQMKNETKMWTDAGSTRPESFQYNGLHTVTEVTVNGVTVPIIEL